MANRSTLINKDDPSYGPNDVGSGKLAVNYSLAVFWPGLFEKCDLRFLDYTDPEDLLQYRIPYLVTERHRASQLWRSRKILLEHKLSGVGKKAVAIFDAALASMDKRHIVLDTWEVWMMEPEGLEEFLLDSLDQVAVGNLRLLMEQAHIRLDQEEVHQYTGFT